MILLDDWDPNIRHYGAHDAAYKHGGGSMESHCRSQGAYVGGH
jgi:hypothetical protein